jgi:PAS domain S-box-containing protein
VSIKGPLSQFMSQLTLELLGITGLLLGLAIILLTLWLTRYAQRKQRIGTRLSSSYLDQTGGKSTEGIVLIKSGGRVAYINQAARHLFGFPWEKPNLERLARRIRPSDLFFTLCAAEGQGHLSINGTYVDASSIQIPYEGDWAMLLTLKRPEISALASEAPTNLDGTIKTFIELSQTMAANLDLESTLRSILDSIERLIVCDFPRIGIWDPDNEYLIPYHFVETSNGERLFEKAAHKFTSGQGYPGYLISEHQPLLVNDVKEDRTLLDNERSKFNFSSYLGLPLMVAGELVGTIELCSFEKGAFSLTDLEVLEVISGHASVALNNAVLYQRQQSRVLELTGLSQLAHAVGAFRDPKDLYTRLVDSIEPLMDVVVIGFWIYDEGQHNLDAQIPFIGIPPQSTELFHVNIPPGSQGEKILLSQETIVTDNAPQDDRLAALELDSRAQAAGILHTVLAPLTCGGKMLGYLQVADKLDGSPFDKDDLRLLSIVASQSAVTIENAMLVHQSHSRAQRAEALRRIASLTRSAATLDEILEFSIKELARLLKGDIGALFLIQERSGELHLHKASLFGVTNETLNSLGRISLPLDSIDKEDNQSTSRSFISMDVDVDPDLPAGYRPFVKLLQVRSMIIVPLIIRDRSIGQIMLGSQIENYFDRNDLILVDTAAGQLAGAIEQSTLAAQTDESLRRHVDELNAVTRISRELNTSPKLDHLLKRVYDELLQVTQANCGSILLINYGKNYDSSPGIVSQIGEQHSETLSPLELSVLKQRQAVSVGENALLAHEGSLPHSGIRSALLAPILRRGEVIGLIHLHSGLINHFDQTALEITQTLATQAAIAIGIAMAGQAELAPMLQKGAEPSIAYQELKLRTQRIQAALDIASIIARQPSREEILIALGREMVGRMDMDSALVAQAVKGEPRLVDSIGSTLAPAHLETHLGQRNPLRHCIQFGKNILVPDLQQRPEWQKSPLLQSLNAKAFICLAIPEQEPRSQREKVDGPGYQTGAVLAISRTALPPFTAEDEQLFLLLSKQVALSMESLRLVAETERRLQEVNSLLEFSQQIGSLEPASILHTLIGSVLKVVPAANACIVATWDDQKECLIPQLASGYVDNEAILKIRYRPGQTIPSLAFEQGVPVKIDALDFVKNYSLSPDSLLHYRDATEGRFPLSCLVIPLGGSQVPQQDARGKVSPRLTQPVGVLILENFETTDAFCLEDQHLASSLAYQTALTLENARLFKASEQRAVQLQALTKVSATITSNLKVDELISSLLGEMKTILHYDTGALWIRQNDRLMIRAAHGFTDNEERIGLSVAVEDSQLLKDMVTTGQPIHIHDTRQDVRFSSSPEHPYLSWLGIPLLSKGEVIGVIALEKLEAGYYTAEHIQAATTFSGQAAVALENARLYDESVQRALELDRRSKRLTVLNRLSMELSSTLDPEHILQVTIQELYSSINCSVVSAISFDAMNQPILQAEIPVTMAEAQTTIANAPLFEHMRESLGIYLCEDVSDDQDEYNSELLQPLAENFASRLTRALLGLPLISANQLQGIFLLQVNQPYHFSSDEIELAKTISYQASIALQNARLFADNARLFSTIQEHAADLEKRVEKRTKQLAQQYERNQILFSIMSQLSASLDMDLVLNRTLGLINEKMGAQHSLIMLLQPDQKSLFLRAALGTHMTPEGGQPTSLKVNEGLVGWVITNRAPALISHLQEDPRWLKFNEEPPSHSSAIAVPLEIGEEVLGALLLYHNEENAFNEDQLELVQATAKQIAVAINNSQLYHLIRDQAERLGDMLRSQHVESSRLEAILEAVADGVLVTDAERVITLFNHSAERILGLSRRQVTGQSLDHFRGVFGKAAQTWVQTIHNWSGTLQSQPVEELYTERIELEDGRVISVHLSPVYIKDEFLGTVSIFRDISHQVEIDRLKSEFVATVSHELRTPMTSIKGFVEILLMGAAGSMTEKQAHYLSIVKSNTERLAILVNDLLDISQIESGRVVLSLQPLDLYETVSKALDDLKYRAMAEKRSLEIETAFPPGIPFVLADRERVLQILGNLLENAYLYTPDHGQIVVQLQSKQDMVQINVKDTGIGIEPRDQAHIFERFYRGEDPLVLSTSGTGLGLSIVQRLVEMHQGMIWLESSGIHGEGTVFSFTLPVYREPNP